MTLWLELYTSLASVVTTTSITLSSNKIQNGDILVPANPVPPGKWPGERESIDKWFVMAAGGTRDKERARPGEAVS